MGLTDRRKTVEISAIGGELLIDRYNSIVVTMGSRSSFFNGLKKDDDGNSNGVILTVKVITQLRPLKQCRSENNDLIQVSLNGHRLLSTVHLIKGEYIYWKR